jgi:hypothetical protein
MNIHEKLKKYISLIEDRYVNNKFTIEEQDPVYKLEQEILFTYGLPKAFYISNTLQKAILDENANPLTVEKLSTFLQQMATDYLQSPSATDREILEEGKINKTVFDNVLPYMNILPHKYCIFIYEALYCRDKITVDEALSALHKFANDNTTYMYSLVHLNFSNEIKIDFEVWFKLKEAGYLYLDDFIHNEINIRLRGEADNKLWATLFTKKTRLANEMNLDHFYITSIEFHESNQTYYLDTIFKAKNQAWYALVLVCDEAHFAVILHCCKYAVQNSIVRSNFENGVEILDLKNSDTPQLEINGITLQLYSINNQPDEDSMVGYYGISCYHFSVSELEICIDPPANNYLAF